MKLKKQMPVIQSCLILPLFLAVAGCKPNSDSTATTGGTAYQGTNATTADADNSGRNVRDRNGANPTSGDQGGSQADRDITQKVRQMIVSGTNDYTMTAKNIKIITANGKVTLRGPVNSPAEKTGIVAIAKAVAGDPNVEDQLEIKTNP